MAPLGPIETDPGSNVGRRLAAIAFVDIVDYTILMARDERSTHRQWMAILKEVIYAEAKKRRGAVIKSTGDGVLVEFQSAFDAVEWACEVQRQVRPETVGPQGTPSTIVLRVAVHLGDIISTGFDVFGHGVNIAARLHPYCVPGSVILSEAVYDLVRGTIAQNARDLGLLRLKNFEKPIRAFSVDPDAGASPHVGEVVVDNVMTWPRTKDIAIAVITPTLVGGLGLVLLISLWPPSNFAEALAPNEASYPVPVLPEVGTSVGTTPGAGAIAQPDVEIDQRLPSEGVTSREPAVQNTRTNESVLADESQSRWNDQETHQHRKSTGHNSGRKSLHQQQR